MIVATIDGVPHQAYTSPAHMARDGRLAKAEAEGRIIRAYNVDYHSCQGCEGCQADWVRLELLWNAIMGPRKLEVASPMTIPERTSDGGPPDEACCEGMWNGDGCCEGCDCQECQDLAHEESDHNDFLRGLPR